MIQEAWIGDFSRHQFDELVRIRAKNPLIADQVAVNYRKADIMARQKAMLDFAMEVAFEAYAVGEDNFAKLAQHGFDAEDAWDIAAIASFFGMSNRMANVISMRPNEEFYTLGRQKPPARDRG